MADYLKIPEVARRLDVSEKTARRLVTSGGLPSVFVGGAYRVSEDDLAEYLREAEVKPPKARAQREGGVTQRALGKIAAIGEEMHSEEVEEYLRGNNARITAMPWDQFEALEDLTLPEFRRHRRALEVERDNLQDAMDGTRISALAVLRAQLRVANWLHPEERRRLERAEELANA